MKQPSAFVTPLLHQTNTYLLHATLTRRPTIKQSGYISEDNSGRGNIFPTQGKAYYRSPTSESVASTGLGGFQGALGRGISQTFYCWQNVIKQLACKSGAGMACWQAWHRYCMFGVCKVLSIRAFPFYASPH